MRLIDADALIAKELEQKEYWMSRGHGDGGTNIVLGALEQAPTVPAEIVVHCRDCRKRNTSRCNMTHNMGGGRFLTCNEDLGYCNLAEMKHTEINKGEGSK